MKTPYVDNLTLSQLLAMDLEENSNYLQIMQVDLGFSATKTTKALLVRGRISERQIMTLKLETRNFLKTMVEKIINKTPLKSSLCRNLSCLNPKAFLEQPDSLAIDQFDNILVELERDSWVDASHCDAIKRQFMSFRSEQSTSPMGKKRLEDFKPGILNNCPCHICVRIGVILSLF